MCPEALKREMSHCTCDTNLYATAHNDIKIKDAQIGQNREGRIGREEYTRRRGREMGDGEWGIEGKMREGEWRRGNEKGEMRGGEYGGEWE